MATAPMPRPPRPARSRAGRTGSSQPTRVVVAPRTLVTLVAVLLGGVLLLALTYASRRILLQLVIAVVLAMALEPLVQTLERRGLRRGTAVGIAFGLVALLVVGFAYLLIPPLVDEVTRFAHDVPSLLEKLTQGHGRLGFLERRFHVVEEARKAIAKQGAVNVVGKPLHLIRSLAGTGASILTVAFLTLFVQLGGRRWFDAFLEIVPATSRERWRRGGSGVSRAVGGYVAGNLLISVIAGTFATLVLLAVGVPYAVPLGFVVAILDLIPLVGATLATVIVGAVALTKGVTPLVIVVGAMVVYQQIENQVLQQLIYNRTVKLSPLAIAVSVAAGAQIGGVAGALLGIPVAGALKVVSAELLAWRRGEDPARPPQQRAL
jgi:predicted PurR-regulated permease PerM